MMISKIIAYRMSLKDVNAHYFENAPDRTFCCECGSVLDPLYSPSTLIVHSKREFALGSTYDGKALCSTAMKDTMTRERLAVNFWMVNKSLGLYHFDPRDKLTFDVEKRNTRFIAPCSRCGGFSEVIGSQPVFLRNVSAPILTGLFRTDLEFGSGRGKGPELIVGLETKIVFEQAKFGGCIYLPIKTDELS